jgi:hypothetical protein
MAEKKDQHLVPACYLKEFIAKVPQEHKDNIHFEKGVYVNNKQLSSLWKMKSITHSIFTKSYYYNLKNDNPKSPIIEEYLSKIENYYSKTLRHLKTGNFSNEILSIISYFTSLQYMRVEPFINMMQGSFDQIAKCMDDFSGNNDATIEVENITKKMLMKFEHGKILHTHSIIIYNTTNFPFLTSDNPVQRRQANIDDLTILLGEQYLETTQSKSIEKAFFYMPLTPKLAYVSCELIKKELKGSILSLADLNCIFGINYHSVRNAHENVYSSIIKPFKGEKNLSEFIFNDAIKDSGYSAKIYTKNDRFIFPIADYNTTNELIEFTTDSLDFHNSVSVGEDITLVEIFDNGRNCRGMRGCTIEAIIPTTGKYTIAPKIKLGI